MRCGPMRLTFPATDEAHVLLDFAFPTEELCRIIDAAATQTGPAEISGYVRQSNQYAGEYTVHFVIKRAGHLPRSIRGNEESLPGRLLTTVRIGKRR